MCVLPEPEYVDLGLSVKWATFNVGATSSNEIGNFYAWGEIEPKDTYTVNNYKWWNKSSKEITKYCTIDSLAYGDKQDKWEYYISTSSRISCRSKSRT